MKNTQVSRVQILQKILDQRQGETYLEVGVHRAKCFHQIKAKRKYAIDPQFLIGWIRWFKHLPQQLKHEKYFKMTSDQFFMQYAHLLEKHAIDAALIDGLHTYEQSLRDVENTLSYLSGKGIIVMHDCNPFDESSSLIASSPDDMLSKDATAQSREWCGDVWKTILHLRATRNDLFVCVLDTDYGLGIVKSGIPEGKVNFSPEEIENLTYDDLDKNREEWLNLKPASYIDKILSQ